MKIDIGSVGLNGVVFHSGCLSGVVCVFVYISEQVSFEVMM